MRKIYYKGTRLYRKDKDWVISGKNGNACVGPETFDRFSEWDEVGCHWNFSVKHSLYKVVTDPDGVEYIRFKNYTAPIKSVG